MSIRRVRAMLAGVVLGCQMLLAVSPASARIPLEEFVREAITISPVLSPSGRFLAVGVAGDGTRVATVMIYDLDAPAAGPKGTSAPKDFRIDWLKWASEDRLLIGFSGGVSLQRGLMFYGSSRVVAVDRDGTHPVKLFNNLPSLKPALDLTSILHLLPDQPEQVLMNATDEYGRNNVYRVNVVSGAAERVLAGALTTVAWLTDVQGNVRVRWDHDSVNGVFDVQFRQGQTDTWSRVTQYTDLELPELKIIGFADDPANAIVANRAGSDFYGIHEYSIASRSVGRQIYRNPNVDVGLPLGGPVYDPRDTKIVGVDYVDDVSFSHYFDPDLARIQTQLESLFPAEASVKLVSWSNDRAAAVVLTQGPRNPGAYFLYEGNTRKVSPIGSINPKLLASEFGDTVSIKFPVRDGSRLPGFLTLPPGKGPKGLPLVVFAHDGPELRDYITYDPLVQFLANRGYAVFQPNFRGSGGYGRAFRDKGYRQWGKLIQTDIADGVSALVKDGTVDPKKICIVGKGFGGYAALAGGAFTPDLFKCVVSIAGMSDLPLMMSDIRNTIGKATYTFEYWKKWIGDPDTDLDDMKAASPAFHAGQFSASVLLMHASGDARVHWNQSVRMEKELNKAGKAVRMFLLDLPVKEPENGIANAALIPELRKLRELEAFLAENIGN